MSREEMTQLGWDQCDVIIVTGASKGIGLAVVQALAAEGVQVVAGARTTETLTGLSGTGVTLLRDTATATIIKVF